MQLFQAEWCPHSHKVRQRLTELGIDFEARQVPADPEDRAELELVAGTNEIPVLVPAGAGQRPLVGEEEILEFLADRQPRWDAERHHAKAREEVPTFDEVKQAA